MRRIGVLAVATGVAAASLLGTSTAVARVEPIRPTAVATTVSAWYYACVGQSGRLRLVTSATDCARGEVKYAWRGNAPGPRGATGPTGAQGVPGAAGGQGLPGPQGVPGAVGATGPVGPQGVAGVTGPAGPTGAVGATGATGATGPAGPAGLQGLVGATGPQGPAGPTGASGATGATGPQGVAGTGMRWLGVWSRSTSYAVGDAVTYNGESYLALVGSISAQPDVSPVFWQLFAAAGAPGAAGPTGPAGPTGAQGIAGPTGDVGPTGPDGPAGPSGTSQGFSSADEIFSLPPGMYVVTENFGYASGAFAGTTLCRIADGPALTAHYFTAWNVVIEPLTTAGVGTLTGVLDLSDAQAPVDFRVYCQQGFPSTHYSFTAVRVDSLGPA